MKTFFKKIGENIRPILQLVSLVLVCAIPKLVDFKGMFTEPSNEPSTDILNYILVIAWSKGNIVIGVFLAVIALLLIRKSNKDITFNHGNTYKDAPFLWYWFCSKVLGYKKCNLVLVPIPLQFKLILNDTFSEFVFDELETLEDVKITINKQQMSVVSKEINIVISDTYPIEKKQLPKGKRGKPTIWITRDKQLVDHRYNCPKFVNAIVNAVKENENTYKIINIFATTNPKSTLDICQKAIRSGDRSGFDRVIVFQQECKGIREFKSKGKTVYKR